MEADLGATAPPRLLSREEVEARTSLSKTTIWRRVRAGEFPSPVRLGPSRIAWVEASISEWIATRVATRGGV
jgi:predicted DNA-binding transcriptional regulator AlpA